VIHFSIPFARCKQAQVNNKLKPKKLLNKRNALLSGAVALALMTPAQTFAQYSPSAVQAMQASQQVMNALAAANAFATAQGTATAQPATVPAPVIGPKKPGAVRIGIILPQAVQPTSSALNARDELRNEWMQLFTGPNLEPVKINAGLPEQGLAEAKALNCDYVVFSTLTQKTDNSGMKKLGLLRAASSMMPMAGMASGMAGMVATTAAQTAMTTSVDMGSLVKAKQEISLQYKLVSVNTLQPVMESTSSAKATQDGQDIITPLVTQAARAMFSKIQLPPTPAS
jgi:hypothetical protein